MKKWDVLEVRMIAIFFLLLLVSVFSTFYPSYALAFFILFLGAVCLVTIELDKVLYFTWLILVFSLFIGSYLSLPGNQSVFLFRILLVLHCILFVLGHNKEKLDRLITQNKLAFLFLVMWGVGCLLTLFWTNYLFIGLRYLYYVIEVSYLIFITGYFFNTKKQWIDVGWVIVGCYILSIGIGFIEITTGWHLAQSGSLVYETTTSQFQPTGFLFNTNDYALYLALFLPFIFFYLHTLIGTSSTKKISVMLWISSLILVISTYSRLGIIAIGMVSVVIYFVYFRKTIIFILFGLSSYVLISSVVENSLFSQIKAIIYSSFTQKGASTSDRWDLYTTTWSIIKDSNFLGIGAGGVPIKISDVRLGYETNGESFYSAHNFFLELLGELGIFSIGLIAFTAYLIFQASLFFKQNNKSKFLTYIPLLMIITFLLASIALSTIVEQRFLWLGLGICLAIVRKTGLKGGKDSDVDFIFRN